MKHDFGSYQQNADFFYHLPLPSSFSNRKIYPYYFCVVVADVPFPLLLTLLNLVAVNI